MRVVLVVLALVSACRVPVNELDGAYYAWDGRKVHCSIAIDDPAGFALDSIFAGMDRVKESGEVFELLVHAPGVTMTWERFEAVLAAVRDRGLPFLTMTEVLHGSPIGGVALMFDDSNTGAWVESMDLLAQYGARVTLYVSRYPTMTPTAHLELRALSDAGHDVEAHSVLHARGPRYVEERGLQTYLEDEVLPSIDVLREEGYEVVSYAYPFGARTEETDRAILDTSGVEVVRALAKPNQLRANPCPY